MSHKIISTETNSKITPISSIQKENLKVWFDETKPWNSGFLSLMRSIAAKNSDIPTPGTARLPHNETYRIGQQPTMAFAPREIASLKIEDGKLHIRLFGLGIWGANGPLPLTITELAFSHAESKQDQTISKFMDIFHHRYLSLFYRAWSSSQSTVSLDRPDEDKFSFYVGSLAGIAPQEVKNSCLPVHARLSSVSHLVREARNPDGLASTLAYYFAVPVKIEEYSPHWIQIEEKEQSKLKLAANCIMSETAFLGGEILDCQSKFCLSVGPLSLEQYLCFVPNGKKLPELIELVRAFVGYEYEWDLKLSIKSDEIPMARADNEQKLGHSTWLGNSFKNESVTGMIFEPEKDY